MRRAASSSPGPKGSFDEIDAALDLKQHSVASTALRRHAKTIVLQADGGAFALESSDDLDGLSGQIAVFSAGSCPFLKQGELHRLPLRLAREAEPRVADARCPAPHRPSEIVPRAGVVVTALDPARSCRQHHDAGEMGVLVHQSAARFWDDPLGANQECHAAAITDAEADQMRRQFLEIAVGQVGHHEVEALERRELTDVAYPDVVNERIHVAAQVK